MRVLFVTPAYKPYLGGVERVLERISGHLVGHEAVDEVGILTTKYDFNTMPAARLDELADEETIEGIRVFRRRFSPRRLPFFYHLPAGVRADVRDVVARFDPDVVHFLFSEWFAANRSVLRQTRDRAHVFTLFYHPYHGLRAAPMRAAIRGLCRSADVVHVVSDSAAEFVRGIRGMDADRVAVTPLGVVPLERQATAPSDAGSPGEPADGAVTILSVGRLARSKGQLELVKAVGRLRERVAVPVRLELVGGDGGERRAIEEYVNGHGLGEAVEMPGYLDDAELEAHYARADIFCLLSHVESYGLVFLEAMGHGLPVVAYGIEPVREILTGGALLAEPGDVAAAEHHLARLIGDRELRERVAGEASALYAGHPSWAEVAESMLSLYRRATARDGAR